MRHVAIISAAAILLVGASAAVGGAQDAMVLRGNHPAEAETATQVGRADENRVLNMSITFALRNRQQLNQVLSDLQDPASPQFHHWLTPAEFNRRFGPRDADVSAVIDWLRAEGFTVNSVNRAERFVSFGATVAQAEHSFAVSIATFGNGQLFANVNDPAIPARFADTIAGIHGLDNMLRVVPLHNDFQKNDKPKVHAQSSSALGSSQLLASALYSVYPNIGLADTASAPQVKTNLGNFFGPSDFYTFYDEGSLLTGGTTGGGNDCVGIVGLSNVRTSAISLFNSTFALPTSTITLVEADGSDPGITSSASETEALLDLEWSHAVAPGAVQRFYAGNPNLSNNALTHAIAAAVTENLCGAINVSFSICGGPPSFFSGTLDPLFAQAASQGQSVFVASGDSGADMCNLGFPNVNELAADPNVTGVGGTQFTPDYDGNGNDIGFVPETVWNDPSGCSHINPGASGGGKSAIFSKPSYQNGSTPADGMRDLPDVAMIASGCDPGPLMVIDSGGTPVFSPTGGTSLAAPIWAGISKLIMQKNGGNRLGNMNPRIYQLAAAQELSGAGAPDNGFRDVTSGENGFNGVSGFPAGSGFDLSTGWGSVDAATFAAAYASSETPTPTPTPIPTPVPTPTPTPVGPVSFTPKAVGFGIHKVGTTSATRFVSFVNPRKNNGTLVIEGIASSDASQFIINSSATTCAEATLPAGSKCKIGMQFIPNAAGVPSATLTINDNAANSPQVVHLRGSAR
jgi:pseudomonalisin